MSNGYETVVQILLWGVGIVSIAWLALSIIGRRYRTAYNLTHAETGGSGPITPDFLKVDHAARQQTIERGAAFDAAPEAIPVVKAAGLSRITAVIFAVSSFVVAIAAAFQRVEAVQGVIDRVSSVDRFFDLVAKYKFGFAFSAVVILAQIVLIVRGLKK